MEYKIVAIDCDGTLLNDKHEIPEKNIKVIRELKEKGIKFIIATGRNDYLTKKYIKQLGITAPVIGCNGATTRDILNNEIFNINAIDKNPAKMVCKYFEDNNIKYNIFTLDTVFTNYIDECKEKNNFRYPLSELNNTDFELKKFEDCGGYENIVDENDILKIIYVNMDEDILLETQNELKNIKDIEVFRSAKTCIDIVAKNVSKGNALLQYLETVNIKPEEAIAIGDSENDLSMLTSVGYSITLINGEDSLKEIANMVTDSNNDAGVGTALEKVFKLC